MVVIVQWCHSVDGGVSDHQPALVKGDWREVEDGGEHGLHNRNDESTMYDELSKLGGVSVRISAVPKKFCQI